jgi:hypothetical protein
MATRYFVTVEVVTELTFSIWLEGPDENTFREEIVKRNDPRIAAAKSFRLIDFKEVEG